MEKKKEINLEKQREKKKICYNFLSDVKKKEQS